MKFILFTFMSIYMMACNTSSSGKRVTKDTTVSLINQMMLCDNYSHFEDKPSKGLAVRQYNIDSKGIVCSYVIATVDGTENSIFSFVSEDPAKTRMLIRYYSSEGYNIVSIPQNGDTINAFTYRVVPIPNKIHPSLMIP